MSRTLFPALAAACFVCGLPLESLAQNRPAAAVQRQPAGPAARPAENAARPPAGVARAVLQVSDLSPELERILQAWSNESKGIEELQGEHGRIVYDHVFEVSKYSRGHFYFKGPDKGRIDLNPE
ncbi:MAG TPA: hypothetical protein VML55_20365, partial [Planctomycetaceae bacterium]|nr:hypothetical protein [Planctomycetaceae bacterium]